MKPIDVLQRFDVQTVLFAPRVSRIALHEVKLPAARTRLLRVNVWRNHAFEPLLPLVAPYHAYHGWEVGYCLSGYDDTLTFSSWQEADAELLWLDSSRMLAHTEFSDWIHWLEGRICTLRTLTSAPIILASWLDDSRMTGAVCSLVDRLPSCYWADLGGVCGAVNVPLLDPRSAALAGTPLSNAAQLTLARALACHWLPGALAPPVKAVALDLDNTLHAGVLGEDGIEGVQLTPAHIELQRYVKSLQSRGVFVALVSRNERSDVESLFSKRDDYPLRWEDFSVTEVSWGDKAAALENIARALRIAPDAILFVDDNPGELSNVAMQLPQVHTVLAGSDASMTQRSIHFYPGLWRWKLEEDDAKRINDLKADSQRSALAAHAESAAEYLRSLQIGLTYRFNPRDQLSRLADLCGKTNQFNLALRRFNQVELADRMGRRDACVASIGLADRFSDSGIVAVIVAERHAAQLLVEEVCISCRALGRQLEDSMIILALREMPIFAGCEEVAFRLRHGPRNQPAANWLEHFLGDGTALVPGLNFAPVQHLIDFIGVEGVSVKMDESTQSDESSTN